MFEIIKARDQQKLAALYKGGWDPPSDVIESVRSIIATVRERGDAALVDFTRRFDSAAFTVSDIRAAIPPKEEARRAIPDDVARALELARERVMRFHEKQKHADILYKEDDGTQYGFCYRPLDAIAAYVPGGSAPLPSSVIMTVVPAKVAGVRRVIVLTPPQRDAGAENLIHPAILYACSLSEVDELYAVGGAHAIAAAAYGTQTIVPIDKVVGPGNVWVTEAKRQVFGACAIDGLAGPSEVLVVADEGANPEFVVGELLAQAEHDPLARVALVSQSRTMLESSLIILNALDTAKLPRGAIVAQVLAKNCFFIQAGSREEVFEVIGRFAPEHLSLQVRNPGEYLSKIRHVGAIFAGDMTPVACGDYIAGTNHVLPTSGAARFSSGLSTADFMRTFTVVGNSERRMRADAPLLAALADFEGLAQHAETARMRAR